MSEADAMERLSRRMLAFCVTMVHDGRDNEGLVSVPALMNVAPFNADDGKTTILLAFMHGDGAAMGTFINEEMAIQLRDVLSRIYPPKATVEVGP